MIVLACTSIIWTVLVLKLFYHNDRRPVPRWLRCTTVKLSRAVFYKLDYHHPNEAGVSQQRPRESASGDDSGGREGVSKTNNGNAPCRTCTAQHYRKDGPLDNSAAVNVNVVGTLPGSDTKKNNFGDTGLDWKDIALVIDRVALVLSAIVTLTALLVTIILYCLQ